MNKTCMNVEHKKLEPSENFDLLFPLSNEKQKRNSFPSIVGEKENLSVFIVKGKLSRNKNILSVNYDLISCRIALDSFGRERSLILWRIFSTNTLNVKKIKYFIGRCSG